MATKNEAELFARTVAAQVRAEIGARDSSVAAIARETGINRETLDRWVKGDRHFSIANLFRVADALGMDTHLLVKRAEERFVDENAASKLAETEARIIVGRFGQNADTDDDSEIPENVEVAWEGRYAADPAGDDPIDHGAP
ncbi:helix-turn-helix domain-containing protein [Leucobacter allii]|uniref:helix-turn-helix domain-containing protein n=1 Tax=Leucobacter allii TaxID=2932247 RepID=UPI001FD44BE0|nr:helix-turn-helix transcriptional regulator [Leucobacter allii]UOR02007.1 helix-turn-helix domain-containing protein [Leucobacter allii]